jgi:hypothetical protein
MRPTPPHTPAAEVCLLLRSHAEARWLGHELVPVLRDLERASLEPDASGAREEELGAALAYLEVLWLDARLRARKTEAARLELDTSTPDADPTLCGRARRYHAAVRRLRECLAGRVERLLAPGADPRWARRMA